LVTLGHGFRSVRLVNTTNGRRLGALGPWLVVGALVFGGCSSDSGNDAGAGSGANDKAASVTETTTAGTSDSTSDSGQLCAIFNQLAANGAGRDAQFSASTPEGWEQKIATTAEMAKVAPAEWRDEAETYHQMMKDRAQLAAENGYVGVNDLPADVRSAFIGSHQAMQAEVNELIAYMGRECGARG
jgi:hypothetical protein